MQEEISPRHATARAFAENGIPVFPCEAGGKKPATEHAFKDATTDRAQIDAWWSTKDYNIGLCPEQAGWAVLDIDGPQGDAALALLEPLPATYEVRTPRGGRHLYFQGSLPPSVQKLGAKIDTRGRNSYILAPPSIVEGKPYQVIHEREIAVLPAWVSERLARTDQPVGAALSDLDGEGSIARARSLLAGLVGRNDVAYSGRGGDDRTYRLACEILNLGLSPEMALQLLIEHWNPHCVPPWTADELRVKIENASRYAQNEAGAWGVPPPSEVFGAALDSLPDDTEAEGRSRFYFEDEDEQETGKEPTWLIKDVIADRSTVLLLGATQSYKSFLALDLALSISTGEAFFGSLPSQTGPVFYAALEGRANIKKARRRAWRVAHAVEGKIENFYVGPGPIIGMPGEMQQFGDEIAKRCGAKKPQLIVLDTLSKSMAGLNENDAGDAGRFIRFCDSLVEAFHCSVIAIHHTGKDDARGARGSSAFHAGFDTVLEVKADRATKAVEVWVRKHKDAEEPEHPFTFEGKLIGSSLVFFPTTREEHRILHGKDDRLSPKTIGKALQDLNAYGAEQAVSTDVLATHLTPATENQNAEEHLEAITRTGRSLAALSKTRLEAYCVRNGRALAWLLLAPREGAQQS